MKDVILVLVLAAMYFLFRYITRRDFPTVVEVLSSEPTMRVGVRWLELMSEHWKPRQEHLMWRVVVRVRVGFLPPRRVFVETYIGEGIDWFVERTGEIVRGGALFVELRDARDKLSKERLFSEQKDIAR